MKKFLIYLILLIAFIEPACAQELTNSNTVSLSEMVEVLPTPTPRPDPIITISPTDKSPVHIGDTVTFKISMKYLEKEEVTSIKWYEADTENVFDGWIVCEDSWTYTLTVTFENKDHYWAVVLTY